MPPPRDTAPDAEDRIGLSEAARILGTSPDTVRRWGDAGYLRMWRVGPAQVRKFSRADVTSRRDENDEQVTPADGVHPLPDQRDLEPVATPSDAPAAATRGAS